jgi:hypothetical protein
MGRVIPFAPGGRGHGPSLVVVPAGDLEEAWMEARAIAGEAERFATACILVARSIQSAIAAGRPSLAGTLGDQLERAAAKQAHRTRVARIAAAFVEERCPGAEEAGPIHGGKAA